MQIFSTRQNHQRSYPILSNQVGHDSVICLIYSVFRASTKQPDIYFLFFIYLIMWPNCYLIMRVLRLVWWPRSFKAFTIQSKIYLIMLPSRYRIMRMLRDLRRKGYIAGAVKNLPYCHFVEKFTYWLVIVFGWLAIISLIYLLIKKFGIPIWWSPALAFTGLIWARYSAVITPVIDSKPQVIN